MATIREIDEQLLALTDPETGELLDAEAFEALAMERDKKVEGMALWSVELDAEAAAIKTEIARLTARKQAAERKAERLREYLRVVLDGQKFKSALVTVSYRTSKAVEVSDPDALIAWAQLAHDEVLKYKEPEISKTELKKLLESGEEVPGAEIVTRTSTQIK